MSDVRLINADVLICKLNEKIGKIEKGYSFRRESMPVAEGMRIMELEYCIGLVQCEPVIDAVQVVHGRWDEPTGRFQDGFWVCSCCNFCTEASAAPRLYKYCPNCGARMYGGED